MKKKAKQDGETQQKSRGISLLQAYRIAPWALGYSFPELFTPGRIPDKLTAPSHFFTLTSTYQTSVNAGDSRLGLLWNPLGETRSAVPSESPDGDTSTTPDATIFPYDAWLVFKSMTGAGDDLITIETGKYKAGICKFGQRVALRNAVRYRLVGAYLSVEYLGNPTQISGTVAACMVYGMEAFNKLKRGTFSSTSINYVVPLDFKRYLFRYRMDSVLASQYRPNNIYPEYISEMQQTGGNPMYALSVECPEKSQFLIKAVRYFECIPASSLEAFVGPTKEAGSSVGFEDQWKIAGDLESSAPCIDVLPRI